MKNLPVLVQIGKISGLHGFDGSLKIELDDQISILKNIPQKEPYFIQIDDYSVPFFIDKTQYSDTLLRVKFSSIQNETEAKKYINCFVYLAEKYVESDLDDVNWLLGFEVFDEEKNLLGEITHVQASDFQIMMSVKNPEKEYLIPLVEDWIEIVDENAKKIILNLPEGILDL